MVVVSHTDSDAALNIVVSGPFDFETSRQLINTCNTHIRDRKVDEIQVSLNKVTYSNSCAIGALLVLSDMVRGRLDIKLAECHRDVHHLFESGLLDRYFGGSKQQPVVKTQQSACQHCFNGLCHGADGKPFPSCFSEISVVPA